MPISGSPSELLIIIVLSSWLNIALYTLEIVLCWRYFGRPNRPLVHKIGVGLMVLADTACTAAVGVDVIMAALQLPFQSVFAPLAIQILMTYISSVVSQLFLSNLFYLLTGIKTVVVPLLVLIFVHLGFSWTSAILSLKNLDTGGMAFTTTTIGAVTCAATDVIIAVCLTWKFWTMMSRTIPEHSTRSLLRRILILTVSSGALCAFNTLTMMILLLKNNGAFTFFFVCQGRVYALTLLGHFLVGTPGSSRSESTNGNGRFGTSVSNNVVVFRSMAVETVVSSNEQSKSSDRLRSPNNNQSLSYTSQNHEELPLGPLHGKADSEHD
ncbi:hypothetical protein B0H13DRAFT_2665875 [Mycena leptocephala]|nr:hypothetical protein B0H13DRAFT_2665875 [Mycena leptocephala]